MTAKIIKNIVKRLPPLHNRHRFICYSSTFLSTLSCQIQVFRPFPSIPPSPSSPAPGWGSTWSSCPVCVGGGGGEDPRLPQNILSSCLKPQPLFFVKLWQLHLKEINIKSVWVVVVGKIPGCLLMFYTATPFLPTTLATAPQRDQYQGFLNFNQRARCKMIATGVCCPTQEIWWIFSATFKKQLRRGGSGLAGKVPLCQITFCQGLLPGSLVGLVGQPSPPGSLIMMSDCHLLCLCLYCTFQGAKTCIFCSTCTKYMI